VLDASADGGGGATFEAVWACAHAPAVKAAKIAARNRLPVAFMVIRSSRFGVLHLKFYGRQMEYSSSLNRRKEISLIPSGADGLEIR
jgi:hypothetical protein